MATDANPGVVIWRTQVGTVSAGPEMKTGEQKIQIHPRVWPVKHVEAGRTVNGRFYYQSNHFWTAVTADQLLIETHYLNVR